MALSVTSTARLLRTALQLPDYRTTWSALFWFRASAVPGGTYQTIVSLNDGGGTNQDFIGLLGANILLFTGATEDAGTSTIVAGTWYHAAAVRSSATRIDMYLDGRDDGCASTENAAGRPAPTRLEIGAYTSGNSDAFTGDVANLLVYNRILTLAEVAAQRTRIDPLDRTGLYCHLKLGVTPGQDSADLHHWGLVGTPALRPDPPFLQPSPRPLTRRRLFVVPGVRVPGGGSVTFAFNRTQASVTPDTAALSTARALAFNRTQATTTPDTSALAVARPLLFNRTQASVTPDTAVLSTNVVFSFARTQASVTPDVSALSVARPLAFSRTQASVTPDTAVLATDVLFSFSRTQASTTPDISALAVARRFAFNDTQATITPDASVLGVARPLSFGRTQASSTWDDIVIAYGRYGLRGYGNGSSVNRVRIPRDTGGVSTAVDIGAGDFTIELWINCLYADNTRTSIADVRDANVFFDADIWNDARGFVAGVYRIGGSTLAVAFGVAGAGLTWSTISGTRQVGDGAWHHVAIDRRQSTGVITLYVDGVADGNATYSTGDLSYPDGATPGGTDSSYFVLLEEKHNVGYNYNGKVDELRISTTRRYTSGFTPSAVPFLPDSSTVGLYHMDTGTGTVLYDSAQVGPVDGTLLVGGSPSGPVWITDNPFGAQFAFARTQASVTPDTVSLSVARPFSFNRTQASATPDTPTLLCARPLAFNRSQASTTPDTATLLKLVAFALNRTQASVTPDTSALGVSRRFAFDRTQATSTPDTTVLRAARPFSFARTQPTTTPDTVVLLSGLATGRVSIVWGTARRPSLSVGAVRRPSITVEE